MSKHNKRPDPTTPEAMAAYEAEMRAALAAPPPYMPYTLFGITRSVAPFTGGVDVAKLPPDCGSAFVKSLEALDNYTANCNTLSPHRAPGNESWTRPMPRVEGYECSYEDDALILSCSTDPDCGVTHRVVMPGQMVRVIRGGRSERASQLADECGALKTENTSLLAENARLRRRIEDMERKGKR